MPKKPARVLGPYVNGDKFRLVVFEGGGRKSVVVASADTDSIVCLDYLTGELRWAQRTHSAGRATILIEPEQIVCAKAGYVDCYTPDGQRRWRQPLTGHGVGRVALGYPGNVAQADERG